MVPPTATNVADWVHRSAESAPERVALVAPGQDRKVTWSELDAAVDKVAAGLARSGLIAGYRIAFALPNTIEFVMAYFGALRAGLVAVPLNPASPPPEIDRQVEQVGARLVLQDPESVNALANVDLDVPSVSSEDPERLAVLQFTSGTSGTPRAAMLTHRALLANLDQMASIEPAAMGSDDIVLGLVPFCHVFGLNAVLGLAARVGATVVLATRFDPEETLALVTQERVTNIPAAPPVFGAWADLAARVHPPLRVPFAEALASVRLMHSGAAPLPIAIAKRITEETELVIHDGYGLTEAAPGVTSTLCSARLKAGSVGSALPGVEVRIAEVDNPDDPGEVLVRGPNLFSGYWPDGADGPDSDGWLATGDLGYIDEDGDLFLVDRSKELVLVSGFNVYPREVEDVIAALPGVAQVAVVGAPDHRTGESVKAYVVPAPQQPGEQSANPVTAALVLAHCGERLARFKCPTDVEIVAELPRSATGKVMKARLR